MVSLVHIITQRKRERERERNVDITIIISREAKGGSTVVMYHVQLLKTHRLSRRCFVLLLSRNKFQMWSFPPSPVPTLFHTNLNNQGIHNKNTKTSSRQWHPNEERLVAYSTAARRPLTFPDGAASTNSCNIPQI